MNDFSHKNLLDLEFGEASARGNLAASFPNVETATGEKYILFFLSAAVYAVSAGYVTEVIAPLPLTPLPKTPGWFLGIANLRGKIISVIDLPGFWNKGNSSSPKSKLILLNSKTTDLQIAFAVEKLGEMIAVKNCEVEPDGSAAHDFCVKIKYKSTIVNLLDAERLFSALKPA
jgi:purine-binding chemotaxis protein CheW